MAVLLEAKHVSKWFSVRRSFFRTGKGRLQAVDDVSLTVEQGETVGVVGESGCGKTTLARLLLRLIEPDSGSISFNSRSAEGFVAGDTRAYRQQIQMVFQNPYESLNPRKTIRHILTQPFLVHDICGLKEAQGRAIELLERVGLRPGATFFDRYPHQFSGGQRQRIGIARALALRPRLIVADEPVSSLDVSVRGEILNLLKDLQRDFGLSYIFISHDLSIVRSFCDRVIVMYLGKIVEEARVEALFASPKHPYTRALMSAVPWPNPVRARAAKRVILSGDVPSPIAPPSGCHFHTRCSFATDRCAVEAPALVQREAGHWASCHHVDRVEASSL